MESKLLIIIDKLKSIEERLSMIENALKIDKEEIILIKPKKKCINGAYRGDINDNGARGLERYLSNY